MGTRAVNSWGRMAPSHPKSLMRRLLISLCKDRQIRSWCNCMSVSHCQMNQKFLSLTHILRKPLSVRHLLNFHCTLLHPAQLSLFRRFLQEELSFPKVSIFLSMYSGRHAQNHKPVNRYGGRAMNLSFPRLANLQSESLFHF